MTSDGKNVALLEQVGGERGIRNREVTKSSIDRVPPRSRPAANRPAVAQVERAPTPLALRLAHVVGIATLVALGALMVVAHRYYEAPIGARVRDPWHQWLKPSGVIGQSLGIYALGLFLFLWLYPLRKKLGRRVERLGSVPNWLDVHIVAGLLVPLVAAVHADWRFGGLIGLGYMSMLVVCLSGVIGRYLYIHIPRGRNGVALTLQEVAAERAALTEAIARSTGLSREEVAQRLSPTAVASSNRNPLAVIAQMVRDDVAQRRAIASLRRGLSLDPTTAAAVRRLARREIALAQQGRMLEGIHGVFRHWHAAHRPFAITALVAVCLHVIVAVFTGQTWFH